jgi:hypothetical protein
MRYIVEEEKMSSYLQTRFIRKTITSGIIIAFVFGVYFYILYKQDHLEAIGVLLISMLIAFGAALLGVKIWNNKLLKLSGTEFTLTKNSLIQRMSNNNEKEFQFAEISIIDISKSGTNIVKGVTRFDYYRPKKSALQPDALNLIFIPNITTGYLDLIEEIKKAR